MKGEEEKDLTLKEAGELVGSFVKERGWEKYHTPRNIVMAMMGEVGEVAEIFQWKGEVETGLPEFSPEEKVHVGEEIADVFSYLLRLAHVCDVDLSQALRDKVAKNRKKYPVEKVKDNLDYYNEVKASKRSS
jgi:dCTP diphosphatase